MPFVGKSGQMLQGWLQCAGIDLGSVYFDNVCQVQPPGNRFMDINWHGDNASDVGSFESRARGWFNALVQRLCAYKQLAVILSVGAWPSRLFSGNRDFSAVKQRGDTFNFTLPNGKIVKVVCTIHPSYLLQKKTLSYLQFFCLRDCTKLRLIAGGVNPDDHQPMLHHATSFEHAGWMLRHIREHLSVNISHKLVVDVETMGPAIDTIGFGIKEDNRYTGYSIGLEGANGHVYSHPQEVELWRGVRGILCDTLNPKGNQNISYDLRYLRDHGCGVVPVRWDTLWAAHVRSPILPRSLANLASLYTWVNYYKEDRQPFGNIDPIRRWQYCAKDAAVTLEVWDRQEEDLGRSPTLLNFLHTRQMPMLLPFHEMEVEGIPVNPRVLEERGIQIQNELEPLQHLLTELRYGKGSREHYEHVIDVGKRFLVYAEERLSSGRVHQKCVKCGGKGSRILKRGSSPCPTCKGGMVVPLRMWKSLLRTFNSQVKAYITQCPTSQLNVKGQEIKEYLFSKVSDGGLGLRPSLTEKGNLQLDEESLRGQLIKLKRAGESEEVGAKMKMRIAFTIKVLETVLRIRELRTEKENFIDLSLSPDGKFRTSYAPLEASGRVHSRPDQYGYGRNYQNFPRKNPDGTGGYAKRAIQAPKGSIFVGFDLKQAEALLVNWDAKDSEEMRAIIAGTKDVHTEAAEIAFGIKASDYSKVEWKGIWRQAGKRQKHGFTYGMGAETALTYIRKELPEFPRTVPETAEGLRRLAARYHKVEEWKLSIADKVRRERKLQSPYGRMIFFYDDWDSRIVEQGLAYRPQSGVADYLDGGIDSGLVGFFNYWKEKDSKVKVLVQKHDECTWMCPLNMVEETVTAALKFWTVPLIPVDPSDRKHKGNLIIPMEFFCGTNMRDTEELVNVNQSVNWWKLYEGVQ